MLRNRCVIRQAEKAADGCSGPLRHRFRISLTPVSSAKNSSSAAASSLLKRRPCFVRRQRMSSAEKAHSFSTSNAPRTHKACRRNAGQGRRHRWRIEQVHCLRAVVLTSRSAWRSSRKDNARAASSPARQIAAHQNRPPGRWEPAVQGLPFAPIAAPIFSSACSASRR